MRDGKHDIVGVAELEKRGARSVTTLKAHVSISKLALTCSVPSESFPVENGYRKTHSSSASASILTQNKNTGP